MKTLKTFFPLLALTFLALENPSVLAAPLSITYSGRMTEVTGKPIAGPVDLKVQFFRSRTGTDEVTVGPLTFPQVALAEGLFEIDITMSDTDFHTLFPATFEDTWIQVTDLTHKKTYTRQAFSPVPFALKIPIDDETLTYRSDGKLTIKNTPKTGETVLSALNQAPAGTTLNTALLPPLAGDVTGAPAASVVAKIQGRSVAVTAPANGDFLKWNTGSSQWEPGSVAGASGGTVTSIVTGAGLAGGPIIGTGTVDLRLSATGGLVKDLGTGTNELGIVAGGVKTTMISTSEAGCGINGNVLKITGGVWTCAPDYSDANARAALSAPGGGPLSYAAGTGVFSLGAASSVSNGYLADTDFIAFFNKQNAITSTSTVNAGRLTTAQQAGLEVKPFNTGAGQTGELRFDALTGTNFVGFKAPDAVAASKIWTLPSTDGGSGDILKTNGAGVLSWGAGGSVSSVNITPPVAGITASGGPVTSSGSITLTLADDLAAVEAISTTGIAKRTAANTWSTITDSSANWDTAFTERNQWDGGATDLTPATGRTSLGLGVLAIAAAVSGGVGGTITDDTIVDADVKTNANITATKLGTGLVDNTEFNYLDGVTSSVQTQLGTRLPLAGGTMSGTINMNGNTVSNGGDILMSTQKMLQVGAYTAGQEGALTFGALDAGKFWFNSTGGVFKFADGSVLPKTINISNASVSSVNITAPAAGITASGGPITSSGAITLALADDLAAVEGISTTGGVERTAANTWSTYTLTAAGKALIDDADNSAQRTTLGLGGAAVLNVGTAAGTVMAGNDSRVVDTVQGPASATDNAIARYDGTTGKLVQNSGVVINDSGNVGIGTTGPMYKLDVEDSDNPPIRVIRNSGGDTAASALNLEVRNSSGAGGTGLGGSIFFHGETSGMTGRQMASFGPIWTDATDASRSAALIFRTADGGSDALERVRISSTGNVGIGTTNPTSKLHVSGDIRQTDGTLKIDVTNGGTTPFSSIYQYAMTINNTNAAVDRWAHLNFGLSASIAAQFRAGNESDLVFFTGNSLGERMRILASGNVGIGTSVPNNLLHIDKAVDGDVVGLLVHNSQPAAAASYNETAQIRFGFGSDLDVARISAGKQHDFVNSANSTAYLTFFTDKAGTSTQTMQMGDGNIGIGSGAYNNLRLVVADAVSTPINTFDTRSGAGTGGGIAFWGANLPLGSVGAIRENGSDASSSITFVTRNSSNTLGEKMRISSTGNVGIGTTAPGAPLDVKGAIRMTGTTSGYVGLQPAAEAGSTTYTFPAAPSAGQFLSTDGSGVLSWGTPAGSSGDITDVVAGPGLTGGATSGSATLNLGIASTTVLGGLKATTGKITLDGTGAITAIAADTAVGIAGANIVGVANGGTGIATVPLNAVIFGNGGAVPLSSASAAANQVLTANSSGTPTFAALVNVNVSDTAAIARTKLANGTASEVLINNGSGVMTSEPQLAITRGGTGASSAPAARIALGAAASGANTDITSLSNLSTPLTVAQGGIGVGTLTANSVLLGNGTSAPQTVAPGTSGNVLTSNGTTWLSAAASGGGGSTAYGAHGSAAANAVYIDATGKVGIGSTTPGSLFNVANGAITGTGSFAGPLTSHGQSTILGAVTGTGLHTTTGVGGVAIARSDTNSFGIVDSLVYMTGSNNNGDITNNNSGQTKSILMFGAATNLRNEGNDKGLVLVAGSTTSHFIAPGGGVGIGGDIGAVYYGHSGDYGKAYVVGDLGSLHTQNATGGGYAGLFGRVSSINGSGSDNPNTAGSVTLAGMVSSGTLSTQSKEFLVVPRFGGTTINTVGSNSLFLSENGSRSKLGTGHTYGGGSRALNSVFLEMKDFEPLERLASGSGFNVAVGNVGIGTTSPTVKLAVGGSLYSNSANQVHIVNSSAASTLALGEDSSNYGMIYWNDSVNRLSIGTKVDGTTHDSTLLLHSGKVGVGLVGTVPQNLLDVGGGAVIGATYAGSFGGPTNGLLVQGNVGIGTWDPGHRFDVASSGAGTLTIARLQNTVAAANSSGAQTLYAANRTTSGLTNVAGIAGVITDITDAAYKGALTFSTANNAAPAERMRIDNTGNVGIGTTSPGAKLAIEDTFQSLPSLSKANATITSTGTATVDRGGTIGLGGPWFGSSTATFAGLGGLKENGTDGNYAGYLAFFTRPNAENPTEWMRISSTGNVGIGTTSPGAKLEVAGQIKMTGGVPGVGKVLTSDASGLATWETSSGGGVAGISSSADATAMTIDSSERVGIGTTSPSGLLNLSYSDGVAMQYQNAAAPIWITNTSTIVNNRSSIFFNDSALGNPVTVIDTKYTDHTNDYGELHFSTRGASNIATRMMIDQNGNVGIGTTAPSVALHVAGKVKINSALAAAGAITPTDPSGVALGIQANATGVRAIAIGDSAVASAQESIAIGSDMNVSGPGSIGIQLGTGGGATVSSSSVMAIIGGNVGIGTTDPQVALEVNGAVRLNTASAKPTCDSTKRGSLFVEQGGAGVTDTVYLCLKSAANTFSWIVSTTGG